MHYIFLLFRSLSSPENRDAFGIIVSYAVKVKLFLGALGGELSAELPFILMHQKVNEMQNAHHLVDLIYFVYFMKPGANSKVKMIHADSQADVETFRQDTIDPDFVD